MNCAELENLICDYVDGTLAAADKAAVDRHLAGCPACAELAGDSAAAVAFMGRAADVEPPPELITRILSDVPWTTPAKPSTGNGRDFTIRIDIPTGKGADSTPGAEDQVKKQSLENLMKSIVTTGESN